MSSVNGAPLPQDVWCSRIKLPTWLFQADAVSRPTARTRAAHGNPSLATPVNYVFSQHLSAFIYAGRHRIGSMLGPVGTAPGRSRHPVAVKARHAWLIERGMHNRNVTKLRRHSLC